MAMPMPLDGAAVRQARLRALGVLSRLGPAACGEAELLALASGIRLPVAATVIERVGGASAVLAASVAELVQAGLSPARAARLVAALELARRGLAAPHRDGWRIRTPADLAERLAPEMERLEREELRVAILNTKNSVVALVTVYVGSLAGSPVRVGEVFRDAVRRHGAAIVVAHNHPSGDPSPSAEDLRITADLARAGRLLDIELLDHLVIGAGRWVSLRSLGAIA
ncbi:MAG TPA: DNA repair protein RadC [Candidatus Limnocylindria bacterium]|nr:DNA repair protein RadC [Candidatus Limnocylindria bacterium]